MSSGGSADTAPAFVAARYAACILDVDVEEPACGLRTPPNHSPDDGIPYRISAEPLAHLAGGMRDLQKRPQANNVVCEQPWDLVGIISRNLLWPLPTAFAEIRAKQNNAGCESTKSSRCDRGRRPEPPMTRHSPPSRRRVRVAPERFRGGNTGCRRRPSPIGFDTARSSGRHDVSDVVADPVDRGPRARCYHDRRRD
jgi:hypothetical protein